MADTHLTARFPRYTSFPTAPHFHAGIDGETYADWLYRLPEDRDLSLYIHVPYCDSLCWFCGCHTKVMNRAAPVTRYVTAVATEASLVAESLGRRARIAHLHFGGGSPTIMSPQDIGHLMRSLHNRFVIDAGTEIAVEIDPRDLDERKLDAWAAAGMTRASIGCQDLDPRVQRAINRIQPFTVIARAVEGLRRRGVQSINIDLVHGLPWQTVEGLRETVRAILSLAPDRIALFGYAHVPQMKPHQRLIPVESLPDAAARHAQASTAFDMIVAAGYEAIGLDHFARPEDTLARAAATGRLHRNFQGYTTDDAGVLIGLGPSSIGELPGGYVQNTPDVTAWHKAVGQGLFATARGFALSAADRLRRSVIERLMCDYQVDVDHVAAQLRLDPALVGDAWPRLAALGDEVEIRGRRVAIPPEARALVQKIAACFDDRFTAPEPLAGRAA
ncbi:oxygen-independent coproporphyrinogen III oxidase [Zavarzinia compransoris]|uniref:Coproporphyrinogen-III oxidase n=1 Tax=Zavarzinia compransoris TaxID=1264899 RepID=A0A317E1E4_9PROT|nr:oxygen-independent coproporphyrinogen III oxidase [Zavarzinia compransoris]PWR18965.1 oxygen-independent coproporphyrinogen III oxidase [Zavarzinia compransoris]TDP48965.1 oxygen-independent coproporphyrinogen-3 oxidase [Zavarzinia compransoris]